MRCNYRGWVIGAAVLAGLLGSPAVPAGELVVYSGRSENFVQPVVAAFTEATGIRVILHSAESTALLNKLRLEGQRTQADLYVSNDAGNLQIGSDLGLFRPLPEALVAAIDPQLRAPDNSWIGLSARARVLVVNTLAAHSEEIRSVFDLVDPRLRGRLGITTAANESFIAGTTVYMQTAGVPRTRAWLEGIKANAAGEAFNKHSAIVSAVAEGKKDVGLVNHYYVVRHLDAHPDAPIRMVMPDQRPGEIGTAWNVAGVAVSRYSRQAEDATRLVEFLVSAPGQRRFAEANNEYPTRQGVPAVAKVPPAGSYRIAAVPMAELGRRRQETIDLIEAVGMH